MKRKEPRYWNEVAKELLLWAKIDKRNKIGAGSAWPGRLVVVGVGRGRRVGAGLIAVAAAATAATNLMEQQSRMRNRSNGVKKW